MRISVILPTYNRVSILPTVIQALEAQTFPRDQFEIIFVDDGSTDNTKEYLQQLAPKVKLLSQNHGGASRARNMGARNALGDILAFTDDDCRPEMGWLQAIDEGMKRRDSQVALLGHTYSEHPASTFVHAVFKEAEPVVTCNFAVSGEAFWRVGGFDEHFFIYFEDEELGLRLKKSGYAIVYDPSMRVCHPSRYQSFRSFLRTRSYLQHFCYMSRKHPDADHWQRHRRVMHQIVKRLLLFGIPVLAGIYWRPLFLLPALILLAHFWVDGRRAWAHRAQLARIGYRLRPADFLAFTFLNWTVPFIDLWRIFKGCVRDWGRVSPWQPASTGRAAH